MNKLEWKHQLRRILYIAAGNGCNALALNLFLTENEIAAGGFFGIAIVLNHFVYVPVGLFVFVLTIPLLIWAWRVQGWKYVLNTLLTTASYSLFVDVSALFLHRVTENLALAGVCGGALIGLGAVMYLQGECSSGGTDLLARLLVTWRREVSLGTMFMIVDGTVILASILVTGNMLLCERPPDPRHEQGGGLLHHPLPGPGAHCPGHHHRSGPGRHQPSWPGDVRP